MLLASDILSQVIQCPVSVEPCPTRTFTLLHITDPTEALISISIANYGHPSTPMRLIRHGVIFGIPNTQTFRGFHSSLASRRSGDDLGGNLQCDLINWLLSQVRLTLERTRCTMPWPWLVFHPGQEVVHVCPSALESDHAGAQARSIEQYEPRRQIL
jgi:hypothetical protein